MARRPGRRRPRVRRRGPGSRRRAARHAVIVEAATTEAASAAVAGVGGRVDTPLGLVGGVAAHVDDAGLNRLMDEPGVRVTPDVVLHASGNDFSAARHRRLADVGNEPRLDAGRSTPATVSASR